MSMEIADKAWENYKPLAAMVVCGWTAHYVNFTDICYVWS